MTSKQFDRLLRLFIAWILEEFGDRLYGYQIRIGRAVLHALSIEPRDVYVKRSRQSGKTESITLLIRFLIVFYRLVTGQPLMCAIASPTGEIAKTVVDRRAAGALALGHGRLLPLPRPPDEFEDQMTRLVREFKGEAELLSVHNPDEPDAWGDAPDSTALALLAASGGGLGEILVL